jgi:hypothetical protein
MSSGLGLALIIAAMNKSLFFAIGFFLTLGILTEAFAASVPVGYVSDVAQEKRQKYREIYIFSSRPQQEPSLQEMIFDPLAKEFRERYREKFNQVDTESLVYQRTDFSTLDGHRPSQATEDENAKRRAFAEYMTRRMLEFHVDNYMKTQPQMQPIMEVKERIQNVEVKVNKDTKLNIQYNFAANVIDLILDNPYLDTKVALEMNPSAFGPSDVNESRLWLGKNLTKTVRANANVAATDGIAYVDLSKAIPKYHMGFSLGYSTFFKESGTSVRQSLYLVGLSHSY